MELFKLFGTIAINNSDANKAIDETTGKAEKAHSKIGGAFEKIGSAAATVGKVAAAGMGLATTGITAMTKSAVSAYADYEQLVGGVETLFGAGGQSLQEYAQSVGKSVSECVVEYAALDDAQDKVMRNAAEAYKTAGLSANEYMETVTSFSASLIASLNGDTSKAADYANQAIIDMSDNANKMGSSMSSIQSAYQGFAKQNYTMLDNLKLGYGGTATEMYRLLEDAAKLDESFAQTAEFSIDSTGHLTAGYADIVKAIHIVQTQMGITGTTAKEAATTISGSVNTMKAAWANFVTGLADENADFSGLMDDLVNSVVQVAENIGPRLVETVPRVVEGIGSVIEALVPYIGPMIEELLPSVLEGAAKLVVYVTENIPSLLSTIGGALWDALQSIMEELEDKLPGPVQDALSSFSEMGTYFKEKFQPIMDDLKTAFQKVKDAVVPLIDKFKEYVTSGEATEDATNAIKTAIDAVVEVYTTMKDLVIGIVDGFKSAAEWGKEHETQLKLIAVAVGTLTTAITAYNVAMAIKKAGGIVELAQLAALEIGIGALTVAEGAHTIATTIATGATTAFGAALSFITSPITLVVLAIGALIAIGVLLYQNWDLIKEKASEFGTKISTTFDRMKESVSNTLNLVKSNIQNIFDNIKTTISNAVNMASSVVSNVFDTMKTNISNAVENIKTTVETVFTTMKESISSIFEGIWATIKGVINNILGGIETMCNGVVNGINALLGGVEKVANAAGELLGFNPVSIQLGSVSLPRLAKGGVLEKGQVGLLEGDGAEAVVPLEQNRKWIQAVTREMQSQGLGGSTETNELLRTMIELLKSLVDTSEEFPQDVHDAIEGLKLNINNREFARLVKSV